MQSKFLTLLGRYTFAIYLVNVLAIGATKAVVFKFISWDGPRFFLVGPILLASGLFVPILVKGYLFRRLPWLDKITT